MNVTICNDKKLKACLAVSISLQHNRIIIKKKKQRLRWYEIIVQLPLSYNYAVVLESQKHSTSPYSNDRLTNVIFRPNVMYF